ncbi:MAG: ferrous iron transport protein B [Pseudomonadota bacterium]
MSVVSGARNPAREVTIALIGNPNTGKTTLFNALTGLSNRVGNYPGVTVEHKIGNLRLSSGPARVIDLPGTYSLAARSPDEMIAVDVLLGQQKGERPVDLILAILDSSTLERNLYLLSQLREFALPIVGSLNMMDVAEKQGIRIDTDKLSKKLGMPLIPTQADKGKGIVSLVLAVEAALEIPSLRELPESHFPPEVVREAELLVVNMRNVESIGGRKLSMVEAVRALVDEGGYAETRLKKQFGQGFQRVLDDARRRLSAFAPLSRLETEARYRWASAVLEGCVTAPEVRVKTWTDRVDAVVTHRLWGSLTLAIMLGTVFQSIYAWAAPMMNGIATTFDGIAAEAMHLIPAGPVQSLLVDGVIGGVGSVLTFLPQIAILFLFMSVLEDCGYMSRAAFLTDRLFRSVGLTGRSVIPLISCFACAVPGIMATRVIENRRQRLATILVAPLVSCSARLPIYVLLIGAFIPAKAYLGGWIGLQGLVLFMMHLVGIAVAVPTLWILNRTVLKGPSTPFFMELPSYQWPTWKPVLSRVYSAVREFAVRAGTIIFSMAIVVWALSYYPHPIDIHARYERARSVATASERDILGRDEQGTYLRQSYLGRLGRVLEPAVRPLGWDWRTGMATLASFPAREVVISTLGIIYNLGSDKASVKESLTAALRNAKREDGSRIFSLAVALSIMVFFALSSQCGATLATIRRETDSFRWPLLTFGYLTSVAYLAALVVYQISHALGA